MTKESKPQEESFHCGDAVDNYAAEASHYGFWHMAFFQRLGDVINCARNERRQQREEFVIICVYGWEAGRQL